MCVYLRNINPTHFKLGYIVKNDYIQVTACDSQCDVVITDCGCGYYIGGVVIL